MISRFNFRFIVGALFAISLFPPSNAHAVALDSIDHVSAINALVNVETSNYFTLESNLHITREGLARTTNGSVNLFGDISSEEVQSLLVNGMPATIDSVKKSWSFNLNTGSGNLNRGVNRIFVQAFGNTAKGRRLIGQRTIDVYLDSGKWTEKVGAIEVAEFPGLWNFVHGLFNNSPWHEIRWPAAEGPYHITSDVIVPKYYRLVIEPGTSLFFAEDTKLIVQGELHAAGTDFKRIRMRIAPGLPFVDDIRPELKRGPPHWSGIQFRSSNSNGNLIAKTDIEYAQSANGSIGVHYSRLHINDVSFTGTHQRMIYTDYSSLIVENCHFDDMFAKDEFPIEMTPSIDNDAEHIKGVGRIPHNGHYIIRNNYFGTNKGHNDVIDVDSNQFPAPILQILNNYFAGAGDEAIDGGGDFLVDGNVFRNIKKDRDNDGDGEANAISTGDTVRSIAVVTRNLFLNIDHAINLKRGSYVYFENNTVVGITQPHQSLYTDPPPRLLDFSVINFLIPDKRDPLNSAPRDPAGIGAYVSGSVFANIPQTIFGHPDLNPSLGTHRSLLEVHNSLVESGDLFENTGKYDRNFGYITGKPTFVDPGNLDFRLQYGSPGTARDSSSSQIGAMIPVGASIVGEPDGVTVSNQATLTIGGPGIFSFLYKINDEPWSREITITDPNEFLNYPARRTKELHLSNLSDGQYTVYVRGRNFAGQLQDEKQATASKSWIIKSETNQ